jgi:RecA/RadA recombinase
MATKKSKPSGGVDLESVVASFNKKDADSCFKASDLVDLERMPTGVFDLDYALGGGIAKGKINVFYGPEGSNKTNVSLSTLNQCQLLGAPNDKQVFIDVENSFDPSWAGNFIEDLSRIHVIGGGPIEEVADKLEAVIMAKDVNGIVMDSVGGLLTVNQLESSNDKAAVGGSALKLTMLINKVTARLATVKRLENRLPTLIFLNQIRMKIGVMFGNPESMPGGWALKHASASITRFGGADDGTTSDSGLGSDFSGVSSLRKSSIIIKKKKFPIKCSKGVFHMGVDPDLYVGPVNDSTPFKVFRSLGILVQEKSGWSIKGTTFKTLDAVKQHMFANPLEFSKLRTYAIDKAMGRVE